MGIETIAVLNGHLGVASLTAILDQHCGAQVIRSRDMQHKDYKIIEFLAPDQSRQAMNVFLNSWAASDYPDLVSGESTMVTIEFSPANFAIVAALADVAGGIVKRTDGEAWIAH